MRVTTIERTLRDLAGVLPRHELLAAADASVRLGADLTSLDESRRFRARLRWVAEHVSDRSDSFAESWSRLIFFQQGVDLPWQQVTVRDDQGKFVARADFGSPVGLLGEFDGRIKYTGEGAYGRSSTDAIMEEKQRENRLRDLGWSLVRWTYADLHHPDRLAGIVADALARAAMLPTPKGTASLERLPQFSRPDWSASLDSQY